MFHDVYLQCMQQLTEAVNRKEGSIPSTRSSFSATDSYSLRLCRKRDSFNISFNTSPEGSVVSQRNCCPDWLPLKLGLE